MASVLQRFIENFAVINAWFVAAFINALSKPMKKQLNWFSQRAYSGHHGTMGMFLENLVMSQSMEQHKYDVFFVIDISKLDKKIQRYEDQLSHQESHLGDYMDYGWDDDVDIDDIDTIFMTYKKTGNKRIRYAKLIVDDIKSDGTNYKITADFDRKRDEIYGNLEDIRITFNLDFNRHYYASAYPSHHLKKHHYH